MLQCDINDFVNTGTLMGITNTLATMPGFIGPSIVGAITDRNVNRLTRILNYH
jgi:hypothetical protein